MIKIKIPTDKDSDGVQRYITITRCADCHPNVRYGERGYEVFCALGIGMSAIEAEYEIHWMCPYLEQEEEDKK